MKSLVRAAISILVLVCVPVHSQDAASSTVSASPLEAYQQKDVGKLTELLQVDKSYTRARAAKFIMKLVIWDRSGVEDAVPELVNVMLFDQDDEASTSAARALGRIGGSKAQEAFFEVVQPESDRAPLIKYIAFAHLGALKDERIEDLAIEALYDTSSRVRHGAALAIRQLKSEKAIEALIGRLVFSCENPDTSEIRGWTQVPFGAILRDALMSIGEPAIPELLLLLDHDCKNLRQGVAVTLGIMGRKEAVPDLIEILADKESHYRSGYVTRTLGDFRDERAIPVLINALEDMTPDRGGCVINPLARPIAYAAYRSLLAMGVKVERIHCRGSFDLYEVVDGTPSDNLLVTSLSSSDKQERYKAALKLGSEFYEGAVPVLMEMVTSADDWKDRLWAARYLGEMRDTRAIPALIRALDDEDYYPDRDPWYAVAYRDWYRPVASEAYQALKHLGVNVEMVIDSVQGTWEYHVIEKDPTR